METKRYTIAIMLGDTQSDYSEDLLRGFFTCAREEDVNILFLMGPQTPQYCKDILSCSIDGDYNYQFDTIYNYVHFVRPDALIITYGSLSIFNNHATDKGHFLEHFKNIPYLLLEDMPEGDIDAPYLMADNYNGMRACIEHLVCDHGYRRIAFLSGPKTNNDANERLNAYRDVLQENGIEVTESMIAYGNYTEQVDEQVEMLLDLNPDLEAIACANDNMAKSCYRVCAARNLLIGTDIAVTGFDDVNLARTMEPSLTSVSHSSFLFSYTALKNAILLCEGKTPASQRMPAMLHKRASCGCPPITTASYVHLEPDEIELYILKTLGPISTDLLSGIPYQKDRNFYASLMLDYFHYIYVMVFKRDGAGFRMDYLLDILRKFAAYRHISSQLLLMHFGNLLNILSANVSSDKERKLLANIIATTQQYVHTLDITALEKEIMNSNRQAWFVPSFTRDLVNQSSDSSLIYHEIMQRLKMMNVKSTYCFLFDEPVLHENQKPLVFPDQIRLVAYYNESEMVYYEPENRPAFCSTHGFSTLNDKLHARCLTSYLLFSGAKQYGLLLCEVEQENISFMQICSLQIGSLLRFIEVNALERESQRELQSSLKVIQEQNHILSFISEYDELTKLLNRRSFMERAIQLLEQHTGQKAYLIFGDLDHLKEINDCFGHAAGDFAITHAARFLQDCLPEDAIIARIGGDEFVALTQSDHTDFSTELHTRLKEICKVFNDNSEKPFYVEISIGIYEFYCDADFDINEIIQKSDALLYEAKASRRKSIKKQS